MFYVCQNQPDSDTIEIIYSCQTEDQAYGECDRTNAHMAERGIPSDYWFFVL